MIGDCAKDSVPFSLFLIRTMSTYTYESAIKVMRDNPSVESIVYKMEEMPHEILYWSVERAPSGFLHHKCVAENKTTKKVEDVADSLILGNGVCPCLPPPSSPLVRQVATGFVSPKPEALGKISIPKSSLNTPESGALAPFPSPLSPLALSRQTSSSLEEQHTGLAVNTHIFFDEDGNEISKNDDFHISIKDYKHHTLHISHPRVLLFYLRFIASYNEDSKINLSWPVLTVTQRKCLCEFVSLHPPPPEFEEDVAELFALVELCPSE